MSQLILSIHTATYNRAHTLPRVYESLRKQTCFDFEWFVTDNGSTDDTAKLFEQWEKESNPFKIRYHRIEERGIPRALNYGVNHVSGKYFFMLDSDDELLPDAVEEILKGIQEIDDLEKCVGVGFVRIHRDGQPIRGIWPLTNAEGFVDCTNLERARYYLDADMCEAYKTDIIRRYPFPVWDDEIYAPEQLCFDRMALDGYYLRWYRKAIYMCDYLEDGQTVGNWKLFINNKMGYAMLSNLKLLTVNNRKKQFKEAAQHIALSLVAGHPSYILQSNKPWLTLLAFPYGFLLSFRRRRQFRQTTPPSRRKRG